jgi:hypothetical protein
MRVYTDCGLRHAQINAEAQKGSTYSIQIYKMVLTVTLDVDNRQNKEEVLDSPASHVPPRRDPDKL